MPTMVKRMPLRRLRMAGLLMIGLLGGLLLARLGYGSPQAGANVLIVTGGHDYDEAGFFAMFGRMEGIRYTHAEYGHGAEEMLNPEGAKDYDAIVFYDMHQDKEPQWQGIDQLLAQGKGIVFLHHSLWSYDGTWDEYPRILGGRASSKVQVVPGPSPTSTYLHGQHLRVHIADPNHPVTQGLEDFDITDETYNHYWVDPNVHVLLTTDCPTSEHVIAWCHGWKGARIVYIELGHGPTAYEHPAYQRLVRQALLWVSAK